MAKVLAPTVSATVDALRKCGYVVDVRFTRGGSPRFKVDGRMEVDAHTLLARFDRGDYLPIDSRQLLPPVAFGA